MDRASPPKVRFAHGGDALHSRHDKEGVAKKHFARQRPAAMTDTAASARNLAQHTAYTVLFAVGFCHLLNDMMQSLLLALYPGFKAQFHLNFAQIGLVTLAFQCTASLLQPVVGYLSDLKPMPYSLAAGMVFTLAGLLILASAGSYPMLLIAAVLIGLGSAVFHPESSRVARMASGGRYGLAQSVFQVGGNSGQALSPLTAALLVATYGQRSIVWYAGLALLGIVILFNIGNWYKHHGIARIKSHQAVKHSGLPKSKITLALAVLLALVFSKFFYLASISSYYTFYLIHTFGVSVQNAQVHLFFFLGAVAVGTLVGGPFGDRIGRKYVIWFSILGMLPFTLLLPYANLFWTGILSGIIGMIVASAFPAIVVYAQELLPGRVGMVSGLFFGFSFGMAGIGAAVLGALADATSITFVYKVCSFLPVIGLLTVFLPNFAKKRA
jgi:FSR family fosmidomycin resistance protein-like MFS transporter